MIRVQLVDDHRILVDGLAKLINESGFATVSASAYSGKACLEQLQQAAVGEKNGLPDILLLDINLPDVNGLDLCRSIKNAYPSVKVVALTSYSEYSIVRQMLDNGASGYVIKNAMPEEILMCLKAVQQGELFLCEQVDVFMRRKADMAVWLTPREKQLLRLIVDGHTNPEIACLMYLGVETINSYRKNLLCKLGARNTAVMVKMALEDRLI